MFERTRIRYALKFGKLEHLFGRLIGLAFIILIILQYYHVNIMIGLWAGLIIWLVYLLSHKIEKRLYPRNFRF